MLTDGIQIFSSQYKKRGVGMSQAVNGNFIYFRMSVDKAAELVVQERSIIKMPSDGGEHRVRLQPRRANDFLLLFLGLLMVPKHLYSIIIYDDFRMLMGVLGVERK